MRDIKFRFRLKLVVDEWGSYRLNDIETFYIPLLDSKIGLTRYQIDKQWEVVSCDEYTGLKDKNGKEIYEGDIVRILYTDWPSNTSPDISLEDYLKSISHIGEIVYEGVEFMVKIESAKYGGNSMSSMYVGTHGRIEVIGNIYENNLG